MTDKPYKKGLIYLFLLIPILLIVMPSLAVGGVDKIGVYRPSQRVFYLDLDGDSAWNASGDRSFRFGAADDVPIAGDWDGDGFDEIGIYRPQHGLFFLDLNGDNIWNASIDRSFRFGAPYDVPIVGDWNGDGVDEVGVYRPQQGVFYLDYDGDNAWNASIDRVLRFGAVNDVPVVGDWNGDAIADIGVFRLGVFYLDLNGNGVWDGPTDDHVFRFGGENDLPVAGDWNSDAIDDIGIYRSREKSFYLDTNGDRTWSVTMDSKFRLGKLDDVPIVGNWNSAPISRSLSKLSMSLTPEAADPSLLEDGAVSGNIYVFVSSESDIAEVRFYLDGALIRTEKFAPYSFSGDSNGLLNPFDTAQLSVGTHVISAKVVFADGLTEVLTASFKAVDTDGDGIGNGADSDDYLRPTVESTTPKKSAVGISFIDPIIVTFSEAVAPNTVSVSFEPEVPATVSVNNSTATIELARALEPSTKYTITIPQTVSDLAGNSMENPYVWSFKTTSIADKTKKITFQDIKPAGFNLDQCWDGIGKDNLGNVYVALHHDGGGVGGHRNNVAIFRYNTKTGKRKLLGTLKDVSKAVGNLGPNEHWPKKEGFTKVHSHITLHKDHMYFTTHDYHNKNNDWLTHRGAHLYSIEIASGTISDITAGAPKGIFGKPGHSIIPLNIIHDLDMAVGLAWKAGDIVVRDLKNETTTVYEAPVKPRAVSREISTYGNKVFFSYKGTNKHLWSLDGSNGNMEKTPMQVHDGWISGRDESADGKIDYLLNQDGFLQIFYKDEERIEPLGFLGDDLRLVWGLVLSNDGKKLYTMPSAGPRKNHLFEYDLESNKATILADLSSFKPHHTTGSGVIDDQGRIYFCYHTYNNDAGLLQIGVSGK